MPEFHSTPPAATPSRAKPSTARDNDSKTGNWLVDAMDKSRGGSDPGREAKGERVRRAGEKLKARDDKSDEPGRAEQRADKPADEKEAAGLNPLAPYLTQWMTPQDYALLGARIQRIAEGIEVPAGVTPAPTLPVAGAIGTGGPLELARTMAASRAAAGAGPAENPFLQALNAPTASSSLPSAPPPPVTRAPAPIISPALPPPPPPTKNPPASDLLKPSTDDKYFKPLKRF